MQKFKMLPTHFLRDSCFESIITAWKPGNFLEIGPGSGNTTKLFLKKGFTGTCLDISKESREMLTINLKEYASNLKIIENLNSIKKESFDYLFIFDVMEHIENDLDTLRGLTGYLKKNGTLLISVPAHKNEFSTSDELMGHLRRYEKKELCDLLGRCGYNEIQIFNYGFPLLNLTLRGVNVLYRFSKNKEYHDYKTLSYNERTQKSGIKKPDIVNKFLFLFNRFTTLPFILLQMLFLKQDWGVAYIAYATK